MTELITKLEQFINSKQTLIQQLITTTPYICSYCVLRCCACLDHSLYCIDITALNTYVHKNTDVDQHECHLCLGILQHYTTHIPTIQQHITDAGYTFNNLQALTSICSTLLIRHQWYLHKYLSPLGITYISDLKELIKHIYIHALQLNIDCSSGLELTLKFVHSNTTDEIKLLETVSNTSISDSLQQRRRNNKRQRMNERWKHKLYNTNNNDTVIDTKPTNNVDTEISNATYTKYSNQITPTQYTTLNYDTIVHTDIPTVQCTAILYRQPIFISGQYNKYARNVSQSPWTVHNKDESGQLISQQMSTVDVESQITKYMKSVFVPGKMLFSSSGREDMDVRMLGKGRLFFIQLIDCKHVYDHHTDVYTTVQNSINSDNPAVQVHDLRLSDVTKYNHMNKTIADKNKYYRCVVTTNKPITPELLHNNINRTESLTIAQHTPLRVAHRRAALCRNKTVYCMYGTLINEYSFILGLCTSSGTYIKEFVHSDQGRTQPNIGMLLGEGYQAEIIQLDVMELFDYIPTLADMHTQQNNNSAIQ